MSARRFTGDAEATLCEEYLAGASTQELADRYRTERITVAKTLRRNGIVVRGAQGRKPVPLGLSEHDEIVKSYAEGDTIRVIAARLGTHYGRISAVLRERGVLLRPRSWKGGRSTTSGGYSLVMVDPSDRIGWPMASTLGYVLEHRLVMARHFGRPLRADETVHHVNGVKSDNRLENLQLRTGLHGNGVAVRCACCGSVDIEEVPLN